MLIGILGAIMMVSTLAVVLSIGMKCETLKCEEKSTGWTVAISISIAVLVSCITWIALANHNMTSKIVHTETCEILTKEKSDGVIIQYVFDKNFKCINVSVIYNGIVTYDRLNIHTKEYWGLGLKFDDKTTYSVSNSKES